jgi:hypothetical protein
MLLAFDLIRNNESGTLVCVSAASIKQTASLLFCSASGMLAGTRSGAPLVLSFSLPFFSLLLLLLLLHETGASSHMRHMPEWESIRL